MRWINVCSPCACSNTAFVCDQWDLSSRSWHEPLLHFSLSESEVSAVEKLKSVEANTATDDEMLPKVCCTICVRRQRSFSNNARVHRLYRAPSALCALTSSRGPSTRHHWNRAKIWRIWSANI
jgi:hypothetical protein